MIPINTEDGSPAIPDEPLLTVTAIVREWIMEPLVALTVTV